MNKTYFFKALLFFLCTASLLPILGSLNASDTPSLKSQGEVFQEAAKLLRNALLPQAPKREPLETECPICLESYGTGTLPIRFNCQSNEKQICEASHVVCLTCTQGMITNKAICPICRRPLCLFDPTVDKANIPPQGENLDYKTEEAIQGITVLQKHLPCSNHPYKAKEVPPTTPPPVAKTTLEYMRALGEEALAGALIGTFVSNEFNAQQTKKTSPFLKTQRMAYIPSFLGTTAVLTYRHPERKTDSWYHASWGLGLVSAFLIGSYKSLTSKD